MLAADSIYQRIKTQDVEHGVAEMRNARHTLFVITIIFLAALAFSFGYAQGNEETGKNNALFEFERVQIAVIQKASQYTVSIQVIQVLDKMKRPAPAGEEGKSGGSGIIISEEGHILSNSHVLDPGALYDVTEAVETQPKYYSYTVTLPDGREMGAEMTDVSDTADLAIIQFLSTPEDLSVASLVSSDTVQSGQIVYAIGSPFGLEQSVSAGIVSNPRRELPDVNKYHSFIQTDATINPGNSGGPLTNIAGEVIGINTIMKSTTGANIGLGFAIPANFIQAFVEKALRAKGGAVQSGWSGVFVQALDADMRMYVGDNLPVHSSDLYITRVAEEGPAHGILKEGDIIISIGGEILKRAEEFYQFVQVLGPNRDATIELLRGGNRKKVKIKMGTPPKK